MLLLLLLLLVVVVVVMVVVAVVVVLLLLLPLLLLPPAPRCACCSPPPPPSLPQVAPALLGPLAQLWSAHSAALLGGGGAEVHTHTQGSLPPSRLSSAAVSSLSESLLLIRK